MEKTAMILGIILFIVSVIAAIVSEVETFKQYNDDFNDNNRK